MMIISNTTKLLKPASRTSRRSMAMGLLLHKRMYARMCRGHIILRLVHTMKFPYTIWQLDVAVLHLINTINS